MLNCKFCQEELTFDDDHVSKSGKRIPLDIRSNTPHRCVQSLNAWHLEHPSKCRQCGETEIYFDDEVVSATGKRIPLEVKTDQPHDCPKSKYSYRQGRGGS